jgi:hypothetical protein
LLLRLFRPLLPGLLGAWSLLLLPSLLDLLRLLLRLRLFHPLLPGLLGALSLLLLPSLLDLLLLRLLLRLFRPLLPGLLGARSLLLLSFLDPLLPRLLSGLFLPLLLLAACLRLLRLALRALLLLSRLLLLLPILAPFGLVLSFVLPVLLRVRRHNRSEKQEQGGATGRSNELHTHRPPLRSLSGMHADDQSALAMFRRLRPGSGLVHRPIRVVGRRAGGFAVLAARCASAASKRRCKCWI